ncbi:hypothetical protein ACOTR2_01460 (plasmid) [Enterobacter asburiae]|nr:hypothetical protein [Enterobacter sp. 262D3]
MLIRWRINQMTIALTPREQQVVINPVLAGELQAPGSRIGN